MHPEFKLIEVAGFVASIEGMRFPLKSKGDSEFLSTRTLRTPGAILGESDLRLATSLIKKGPVHSKFRRGIKAWFHINMPLCIWSELDTYTVGVDPISSESTMFTLIKECGDITSDMFVDGAADSIIEGFKTQVADFTEKYGSRKDIPIDQIKYALPSGWMQARNRAFSYEALASMHHYRKNHRMPEWREVICPAIEKLPYFKELILGEL